MTRGVEIEALSPLRTADRALFAGLIDYAGLFPPASLELDAAMAEYRAARGDPHGWLLGRFIITASRLEELGGRLMATMQTGEKPWAISAILDGDVAASAVATRAFDAELEPGAQIAVLEVPLPAAVTDGRSRAEARVAAEATVRATLTASAVATPFFEVAVGSEWQRGISAGIGAISELRAALHRPLGAKLRCGGVVAEAFPDPAQVVAFITACVAARLPFKATAGLHHPIRHEDRQLGVMRHGFLNLLMASVFAQQGAATAQLIDVVADTDPDSFQLTVSGAAWRGHRARIGDLTRAREQFAAYGSCSFAEPIDDLVALGMVTAGPS